jgi:hypothetical protein
MIFEFSFNFFNYLFPKKSIKEAFMYKCSDTEIKDIAKLEFYLRSTLPSENYIVCQTFNVPDRELVKYLLKKYCSLLPISLNIQGA